MYSDERLVSVIMGTRYLRDDLHPLKCAVESILAQTYLNFEFLICDDGSTPAATRYLDDVSRAESRVRLLRGLARLDLASKLNLCLSAAQGEYIARMDDDDYSRPERFIKQLAYLENHEKIAFVGCNVTLVRNGVPAGVRTLPEGPTVRDFYMAQPYIHPALMFRREVLVAVGGYSEEKRQVLCEDYDLLLRMYAKGYHGANLQEPLLDYTLPASAKGNRTMAHRWNEAVTRYHRFKELGRLPEALPWVVKPLAVGLLPEHLLTHLQSVHYRKMK